MVSIFFFFGVTVKTENTTSLIPSTTGFSETNYNEIYKRIYMMTYNEIYITSIVFDYFSEYLSLKGKNYAFV